MSWGVEQLEVRFGRRMAIDRVSLDFPAGQVTAVVGGDGAGKTTLVRSVVGAVRPSGGRLRLPAPREIGYVPAGPGSYGDLTVIENLDFVGSAFGLRGREFDDHVAELLDRTELAGASDRLASRLSGGMRRKLAVALALVHRPRLLALDEPSTGVDPVSRVELWRLITASAASGAAVLVSTTYVNEAQRAAMVTVLERGRALTSGSPEEVIAAIPGIVGVATERPPEEVKSWRRGTGWRAWSTNGSLPDGVNPAEPDLSDAVIVAALEAQERREADS